MYPARAIGTRCLVLRFQRIAELAHEEPNEVTVDADTAIEIALGCGCLCLRGERLVVIPIDVPESIDRHVANFQNGLRHTFGGPFVERAIASGVGCLAQPLSILRSGDRGRHRPPPAKAPGTRKQAPYQCGADGQGGAVDQPANREQTGRRYDRPEDLARQRCLSLSSRKVGHRTARRLPTIDPSDDDCHVVGAASQIGEVHEEVGRIIGIETSHDRSDFLVFDLARESVTAKQEHISCAQREGAFDIDVDFGSGTDAAGDDVPGHEGRNLRFHDVFRGADLPNEAVVERQLLQFIATQPVDTAIADVSDECLLWEEDEGAHGCPHASQFIRLDALPVDFAVGFAQCIMEGIFWQAAFVGPVDVQHGLDRHTAGDFPRSVSAHAVGDDEQMAWSLAWDRVLSTGHDERILIVGATQPNIAEGSVFHRIFALGGDSIHQYLPIVLLLVLVLFRMHSCCRRLCPQTSTSSDVDSFRGLNVFFSSFDEGHFIAGLAINNFVHEGPDQRQAA